MMLRQGDILLVPCEIPEEDLARAKVRPDGVIARGELTGHAHRVDTSCAQVLDLERKDGVFTFVRAFEPTFVRHEEHGLVPVEPRPASRPGFVYVYEARRQREATLEEALRWRAVAD